MERENEGGKAGDREVERTALPYKIQTSSVFPGNPQPLFILLGGTDLHLLFQDSPVKCSDSVGRH